MLYPTDRAYYTGVVRVADMAHKMMHRDYALWEKWAQGKPDPREVLLACLRQAAVPKLWIWKAAVYAESKVGLATGATAKSKWHRTATWLYSVAPTY